MPLRNCSIEACESPADRASGSCMICGKHLCAQHIASRHSCPSCDRDPEAYYSANDKAKRRYLEDLLNKIDVEALQAVASKARHGILCHVPAFLNNVDKNERVDQVSKQCGGQNCNVDVEFADGVTWIARIRLDDPLLPPKPVQKHIFLSEVATLLFLENTNVPAPHVHSYAFEGPDNPVGTSYVLMEKLAGKPLQWGDANEEQRHRVTEQLADIYLELEKHPMPLTGSLALPTAEDSVPETSQVASAHMGGFAQASLFSTPNQTLGPFDSLEAAYTAIIQQHLQMLASGEIGSSLPVDNYLSFLWRLQKLPELVARSVSDQQGGPFFLRHYDDKGDHILVDEAYNITGIIDWEFASFEAKEFAFSSPCMMWPVGEFFDGSNVLSADEERFAAAFDSRSRPDVAQMVRGGRQWQRYLFFLGGGLPRDMDEFAPLFQGLRESLEAKEQEQVEKGTTVAVSPYLAWKTDALNDVAMDDAQLRVWHDEGRLTLPP